MDMMNGEGSLKNRVIELCRTEGYEPGQSVAGDVISFWKMKLNTEGFCTTESSIRATLWRCGYTTRRTRPNPTISSDLSQVERCGAAGLTDEQTAIVLDLPEREFRALKLDPEFGSAYARGLKQATKRVEQTLFVRACGYTYDEVTRESGENGALEVVKVVSKHVVPDTQALLFWLKNRDPKRWKADVKSVSEPEEEEVRELRFVRPEESRS